MEEAYDDAAEMELKDPNEMTSEERGEALVEAIRQDDLLGVLLYLGAGDDSNTISESLSHAEPLHCSTFDQQNLSKISFND